MKKNISFLIFLSFIFILFNSCKKDITKNNDQPNIELPDLSTRVNASVSGFITAADNSPIAGVQVTAGTGSTTTNEFGYFRITNVGLGATVAFVKATKPGFFAGIRTFIAKKDEESFVRIKLITKTNSGDINTSSGGSVSAADGSTITISPNTVMVASNNNPYTGTIHIASHWIDPSSQQEMQSTMPGDLSALDKDGYLKQLTTYGMLAVELTGDAGELLQIASGNKATLNFPIPASLTTTAPSTIPLWSFDESNGLWKEEGSASKSGNSYIGEVSHFSFWNVDVPVETVNFTAQIKDADSNPLVNVLVSVAIVNEPNSSRCAYTNSNGFVNGMIPKNENLVLTVLSDCNISVYSQNFTTTNLDVDLGTITTDIALSTITVAGIVSDCNQNPVMNGFVIISGNNTMNYAAIINNGAYNTTYLNCLNGNYTVTAIDIDASQQSIPSPVTLSNGLNNLSPIIVCGSSTAEYLIYSVDGVVYQDANYPYNSPIGAQYGTTPSIHTYISVYDSLSNDRLMMSIENGPAIGIQTATTFPGGFVTINHVPFFGWIKPVSDYYNVNVTEYGQVGGYISVSYSGQGYTASDFPAVIHNITFNFRVKRQL